MNDFQRAETYKFRQIVKYCSDNQTITDLVLAFKNGILSLNDVVTEIESISAKQKVTSKPDTIDKKNKRLLLCDDIFYVISPTYAYAVSINDEFIKDICKYPISGLREMNDENLLDYTNLVIEKITPIVAQLADYGIYLADVQKIGTSLATFKGVVSNPINKIADRHAYTERLKGLITIGISILENTLDKMIILYKKNHKGYYNRFWNLSNLIIRGKGIQMGVSFMVINSIDNEVLEEQKVHLSTIEVGVNPIDYTNSKGIAFFHCKTPQTCNYTIEGEYTTPVTGSVTIEDNKITYIEVYVTPV